VLGFPFICQGKDPGYKSKREKGRKIERKEDGEERWSGQPWSYTVLPPAGGSCRRQWRRVHVVVMSFSGTTGKRRCFGHDSIVRHWSYRRASPLDRARPVCPCHMIWPTDLLVWSHTGIKPHSAGSLGIVGDIGAWYSLRQPLVTSRCPHPPLALRAWSGAHYPCSWRLGVSGGPHRSLRSRPTLWLHGQAERFRSQGVG
jgi:hypothetical protein